MTSSNVDPLAQRVLDCYAEFDAQLYGSNRFPLEEFDRLWDAVARYAAAIDEGNLIHRAVAREISGLREHLELARFRTPRGMLARADRMECILFSGYDPCFEGDEPPGL